MAITTKDIQDHASVLLKQVYDGEGIIGLTLAHSNLDLEACRYLEAKGYFQAVAYHQYRITFAGRQAVENTQP